MNGERRTANGERRTVSGGRRTTKTDCPLTRRPRTVFAASRTTRAALCA
ncbi:hypothetical protein BURPS668_A1961 [Burkholderia pseudomallei 668]|nr:hypothetical protein BURPS668_A1961 [Burkholderia pseudomallei 668]